MKWVTRNRLKTHPAPQCIKSGKAISLAILILLGSFSFGFAQNGKNDSAAKSIILFVCEHGAARSPIATAYFNKMAKEKGLNYTAIFRGINPDTSLSVNTQKGLTEDGFDIKNWQPKLVTRNDVTSASEIITLDCILTFKDSPARPVYQWNGIPPISESYQAARNDIANKVAMLIKELELKSQQRKAVSKFR